MGGMPGPHMYPPQGSPMFYAPGMPPRNFMYPQQMVPRWQQRPGQPPQQMMVAGGPAGARNPVNYQLMPVQNGGRNQPPSPATGGQPRNSRNRRQNGQQMQGQMQGQRRQQQNGQNGQQQQQ